MASQRDYYQILGVAETATTDEVKKAFRRLAKQYHPDRNPNKPQAADRFKEINEAHDVLSDPEKRKRYDQLRRYGAFAGAGSGGGARGPTGGGPGAEFDLSDLGSFGGLGDLFSSIFGRRSGGPRAEDEDEIETAVSIPFRVAALGGRGAGRRRVGDPGRARRRFPTGRARRHRRRADQSGAGAARLEDQSADARRQARRAQGAARHTARSTLPHPGPGDRAERTAGR